MPFIHIRAYSGRDKETQLKAAQAVADAASAAMGAPKEAFTVIYEEFEKEEWQEKVYDKEVTPRKDKILILKGEVVK